MAVTMDVRAAVSLKKRTSHHAGHSATAGHVVIIAVHIYSSVYVHTHEQSHDHTRTQINAHMHTHVAYE